MRVAAPPLTPRERRVHAQRGLTLVELLVGMTLLLLIAAPVASTLLKSMGVRSGQMKASTYQANVSALVSTFLKDVRSATALVSETTATGSFTLHSGTSPTAYITYRFANDMLQRGTSPTLSPGPTSWKDMFDGSTFKLSGSMAFLTTGGSVASDAMYANTIQIVNFKALDKSTRDVFSHPTISAMMGSSGSTSGILALRGTAGILGNNTVTFSLKNVSARSVTISGYAVSWNDRSANSVLQQFKCKGASGDGDAWKGSYDNYWADSTPVDLDDNWTLSPSAGAGERIYDFRLRFNNTNPSKKYTVCFYGVNDAQRDHPFVLNFVLPDGTLSRDDDHHDEDSDEKKKGPKTLSAKYKSGHDRYENENQGGYDKDGRDRDGH